MNVAFIDVGSTTIKYQIYNKVARQVLDMDKIPFPAALIKTDEKYEVAIDAIDEIFFSVINKAVESACHHALISVQMHGYVLMKNGRAVTNYISWRDQRGDINNPVFDDWDWYALGTSRKKNLAVVSLYSRADIDEQTEFCTLGSYFAFLLTGQNATHITDASASGLFYADSCAPYEKSAFRFKLPKAKRNIEILGEYCGMKIYTPLGDHQVSFYGSLAGDNAYLLNIGTATQISALEVPPHRQTNYEARPYFDKASRLATVTGLVGGEALKNGCSSQFLIENYKQAFEKLPHKEKLVISGGGADFHREQLCEICTALGVPFSFADQSVVFKGLRLLEETVSQKIGVMLSEIPFENFPFIVKQADLDFLIIDNEHGAFEYHVISRLILNAKLTGLPMIIRLSDNLRMNITKFADMGATGFLLPMTNSASDIKQVVEYAKYAPIGKRGISTTRAHTLYNPPPLDEYMKEANETVKVYAQIETRSGVANIDEILAVSGVDGVFIGPNDLACDLDCIGQKAPVTACIRLVCEATKRADKFCGIITTDKNLLDCAIACGVDMISYGSELNMLIDSCNKVRRCFYD